MSEDPTPVPGSDEDAGEAGAQERPPEPLDEDDLVDESSMESFPASDPPSVNPGAD